MSKYAYGKFPLQPKDLYPTPRSAVEPLIPYLADVRTFAEPCCGPQRLLVKHIEELSGPKCLQSSDICEGVDALSLTERQLNPMFLAAIITNPPHSRHNLPLMHAMIEHFRQLLPTWLLLYTDWLFTKQAVPFLPYAELVVPIRRIQIFEGSSDESKGNYCWVKFIAELVPGGGPRLMPAQVSPKTSSARTRTKKAPQLLTPMLMEVD